MLNNQGRYFPLVASAREKERENRKLGAPAKTARLKATVRELLGFLRRKAPLAEGQPWKGEGLIASTRFPYVKPLYGGRHEISEGPITASGGAPSSRISGINSTLCDIQICAVEFFSLTRFYPAPLPFLSPLANSRTSCSLLAA